MTAMQINPNPATDPPDYITPNGISLWMVRKGQRTHFIDRLLVQVGPTHANLVPAIVYAASRGWRDPYAPDWLNDGVIREVFYGGAPPQPGQRNYDPAS